MQRKHTRFKPDEGTMAWLEWADNTGQFSSRAGGRAPALVVSESHGGCGLVVYALGKVEIGTMCKVQVGSLPLIKAELRWVKEVDHEIRRIGLKYLE